MAEVRHYKFDDNAASTTLVATVGTNGALTGGDNTNAKAAAGPGGIILASLDLNGIDDGLGIQEVTFGNATAFTWSGWVRFDSLTNPVVFGRAASAFRYGKLTSPTVFQLATSDAGADFTIPEAFVDTWYHYFITRTAGNSARLWWNGTESVSGAIALTGESTTNVVGQSGSTFSNAKHAQFRVFNTDESANVATYYAEGVSAGGGQPAIRRLFGTKFRPIEIGREGAILVRAKPSMWVPARKVLVA